MKTAMPSSEDQVPLKSSMEILSELFSSFHAEPPVIVKKEKDESRKHKKSKKKHKHKEKKHKKKAKKRKLSPCSSSTSSETDLAEILIKKELENPEKKLKLSVDVAAISQHIEPESSGKSCENGAEEKGVIKIADLKLSSIFTAPELTDKHELSDVEQDHKHRKKEKHKKKHKHREKRSRSKSRNRERSPVKNKEKEYSKGKDKQSKEYDKYKERDKERHKDDYKCKNDKHKDHKSYEREFKDEHRLKDRERDHDDYRNHRYKVNSFYKDVEHCIVPENKLFFKDRGDREKDRDWKHRSYSIDRSSSHIDKKKLLEIARKNAIQMMKSGNLPGALNLGRQAQEKVLAAIKSGGKTIEELTDFCKSLSKQEEIGELSSISDDNATDSENDAPFHHPFQIKERPASITMNIKNSVPLPLKTTQERASELRIQFPVSSGQQHRRTESEWVPVSPKKVEPPPIVPPPPAEIPETAPPPPPPVVVQTPPPLPETQPPIAVPLPPGPQVFPPSNKLDQSIDIASIVSQRLTAMRKLQENPHDCQAISEMYKAQKEMNFWAESKQQIGQFTGSTGAQILTQAELNAGYQAWARKDQLQTAAPVSGGMGMHLLQKMGWKPGEGLGKEKTGTLEPLLLEVKLDKKGIVAKEEQKKKQTKQQKGVAKVNLQGKHPVSLLGEYASKQKLGAPQYALCFECGPDHKKNFLFKVVLNNVEYKPNVASPNKKEAKANAASVCLQQLGILAPST